MKKIVVFTAVMLFGYMTAWAIDLKYGETFKETILELEFSEGAIANEAFVSWDLVGDWDKFSYHFSQGTVKKGVYTISAADYLDLVEQSNGISLTLKGKSSAKTGNYELSMIVKEVSKDMAFEADELDLEIPIEYEGKSIWLRLLVPAIILIALVLLLLLVLHVTAKFPEGLLQLGREEVELKGKKKVSLKKELEDRNISLGDEVDVVLVKKRFVSFQGPKVSVMNGCELKRADGSLLAIGDVIYPEETIYGLKDANGEDILIHLC